MNRREIVKGIGMIALSGSFPSAVSLFLSSCNTKSKKLRADFFSPDEFHLTELAAETLLPKTSTPGASEAQVPFFIELVVKDCLNKADQEMIRKGLLQLNQTPEGNFLSADADKKLNILKAIDAAAYQDQPDKAWFRLFKKLATIGYFTSKEGMNAALNYVQVPGDYKECIPYVKNEKAMAKTFLIYY